MLWNCFASSLERSSSSLLEASPPNTSVGNVVEINLTSICLPPMYEQMILYTFLPIPSGLIIFIISLHKNLDKKYYTGIYYINVLYRDLLHKRIIQFFCNKKTVGIFP